MVGHLTQDTRRFNLWYLPDMSHPIWTEVAKCGRTGWEEPQGVPETENCVRKAAARSLRSG